MLTAEQIQKDLFGMQDLGYRDFSSKLMPTIEKSTVIGVRTPILRKYAREIVNEAGPFLEVLPHKYYEENNLHGFLVSQIRDFDACIKMLDRFLPYVDNWATCDGLRPRCFKNNKDKLLQKIDQWLMSDHTYTVRFAIEMLMTHFLDEDFDISYADKVAAVRSEEYYIKMMVAWYFATALAKQYDFVLPYLQNRVLDPWTHNKTIQKSVESYRITAKQKEYLKKLRICS